MIARIQQNEKSFTIDLSKPLDLSIAISPNGPRAWYVDRARISPVLSGQFTGSILLGGNVNFNEVKFNPHGHGTHTESVGHITREWVSVNDILTQAFFTAQLITLQPEAVVAESQWMKKGDAIITDKQIQKALGDIRPEALVIRTLPNTNDKKSKNYSATNFPYFTESALAWLAEIEVQHLLVDLPSVDREEDGGWLKAHHAFWKFPEATRTQCTITEFIFVKDEIKDGEYLLNLQTAAFENDATPSRPLLYEFI